MTLSFKTQINGVPTLFMEKIHRCIFWDKPVTKEYADAVYHPDYNTSVISAVKPKLHTIREDLPGRWKPGMAIHMVIHNRTKKRFQFAPEVPVVSIQEIEIKYEWDHELTKASVIIDGIKQGEVLWKNCQLKASSLTVDKIAENDGFDSVNDFFEWFSEDFKGKIIHWTDHKY